MPPPRYASTPAELDAQSGRAKGWRCPHCGREGTLNRHGVLRGNDPGTQGKEAVRGRRFYCSKRGRRPGCGRTVAVWLAEVIAGASVRTAALWRFLSARLGGLSVLGAWERTRCGFSVEAAYRWWRRWRAAESAVRARLWRGREPPAGGLVAACEAHYGATDPIAGFQMREQRGWPGFGP